jgi:hypothetical protein
MKLFLFSFLLLNNLVVLAQPEEIEHVKIGLDSSDVENLFPHIDHIYDGEILISQLGDLEGIQTAKNYKVLSFVISYPHGEKNLSVDIKGNVIPKEIIEDIYKYAIGEMIFITNIVTEDINKHIFELVPMNLIPIE